MPPSASPAAKTKRSSSSGSSITSSINPNWPQYACTLAIVVAVLAAAIRYLAIDWDDRDHCKALVRTGRWMTDDFKSWQPEGCMTHAYAPALITQCLPRRRVVFLGDSSTRDLFFAVRTLADPLAPVKPDDGGKHADLSWSTPGGGPEFQFFWDPYLNSTHLQTILAHPYLPRPASEPPSHPALLVLGSGLWYLREPSSGGIAGWEARIDHVFGQIAKASSSSSSSSPLGSSSNGGGGRRVLADEVVVLPVPVVVPDKLSAERKATLLPADIDAMNSDLLARLAPTSSSLFFAHRRLPFAAADPYPAGPPALANGGGGERTAAAASPPTTRPVAPPVHLPTSFNDLLDPSQTTDGLHYSAKLNRVKAQLLLNLRCNDALPKHFPMDKTCCRRYPGLESSVQAIVLALVVLYVPLGRLLEARLAAHASATAGSSSSRSLGRLRRWLVTDDRKVLAWTVFGLCVGLTYLSDRTGLWLKENKSYDGLTFGLACLAALVGGLATMQRSEGGKDLGFLNREQTDEWKGWMQIVILIYHYLGASKISGIYNPVRVLVASYLFMTGYGHFTFYYKKADFGIDRIAMVMVRLNLLPVVLAYTMQTDYVSYYFSPLVSFWYLIIYATMRVGSSYNGSTYFLLPKLAVAAGLVSWFMLTPWLLEGVFAFLGSVANIHWSATEWAFRVNLDLFVVWLGMLTAYGYIKAKELGLPDRPWFAQAVKAAVGGAILALGWFFWFELRQPTKFVYNRSHPVVSFVPVLAFVVLRNSHPRLRSVNSRLWMFVGQISLETFILQFHLWLGADTKGVLLVLPGTKWRPLNVVLTTVIFIFVSQKASQTTGQITTFLVGKAKKAAAGLPPPATAPASSSNPAAVDESVKQESIPLLETTTTTPAAVASADKPTEADDVDDEQQRSPPTTSARRPSAWPEWMRRTSFAVVSPPGGGAGTAAASSTAPSFLATGWLEKAADNNALKLGGMLLVCWILNLLSPWP